MSGVSVEQFGPLLLLPALAVLVLITSRWLGLMSGARRLSAVVVRLILIAVITLALAGASMIRTSERVAVIVIADVSGSVQRASMTNPLADAPAARPLEAVTDWLARAIVTARPDDLVGIVAFDGRAVAVTPLAAGPVPMPDPPTPVDGTDIASAIRAARAMAPPSTRIRLVLVSDGNQTIGDAEAAAAAARAPIDVLPIRYRLDREVVLESLDAPPRVAGGPNASIQARAVLRSVNPSPVTGTLRVSINDEPVVPGIPLRLEPGVNVEALTLPISAGRVHRIRADFEPDTGEDGRPIGDTLADNNRAEAITLSTGPASVLLIDPSSGGVEGSAIAAVLRSAGFDVESHPPERLAADPLWMQTRDAVVLVNVPADAMERDTHALLRSYVIDAGGGLFMVGGPDSFAPGGWRGTAIEPILPVALDLPERLITPGAAVMLVIDVSGSMRRTVMGTGLSQMRIAAEGAAEAIRTLDRTDLVGVVTFSDTTRLAVPLASNRDPDVTAAQVRRIAADGGTIMGPALEMARAQLNAVEAEERHIILLSDGRSQDVARIPQIARSLAEDGIRTTTIAVGDRADMSSLRELAATTAGRFYPVVDPTLLPRVLIKAVRVVRTPMIKRGRIGVVPASSDAVSRSVPPELSGVVMTRLRADPSVTHVYFARLPEPGRADAVGTAMAEPTPLLAHWNVGTGRVGAFASDAREWASAWLSWEGFAQTWLSAVEAVARARPERGMELRAWVGAPQSDGTSADSADDRLWIRVEATDDAGTPLQGLDIPAKVYAAGAGTGGFGPEQDPARGVRATQLEEIAPGVYQGLVPAEQSGAYVVVATPRGVGRGLPPLVGGVVRAGGAEYRALASNPDLLEQLRSATGGRPLDWSAPESAGLFDRTGLNPALERRPLWRSLLWAALVFMMVDVATRRIAWDRYLGWGQGESARAWRERTAEAMRDRSAESAAATERLRRGAGTSTAGVGAAGPPTVAASRARAGETTGSAALEDRDALELVRRAAERRRARASDRPDSGVDAATTTFKARVPGAPAQQPRSPEPAPPMQADSDAGGASAASLFEAKRRARERIEGDAEEPPRA